MADDKREAEQAAKFTQPWDAIVVLSKPVEKSKIERGMRVLVKAVFRG